MTFDLSPSVITIVVGFPLLLLMLVLVLARIEDWMLMPDERAAAVSQLLEQVDEAEELEKAVARLMSEVSGRSMSKSLSPAAKTRATRLARRRRA